MIFSFMISEFIRTTIKLAKNIILILLFLGIKRRYGRMFEGILILEEFIDEESLSNPPPPIYRNKLRPGFFDNFTAEVQILFFVLS